MSTIRISKINTLDDEELENNYQCEMDDGSGTHEIELFECVTRAHFDCSIGDLTPNNLDLETEVLWFDCSCGHQTYT